MLACAAAVSLGTASTALAADVTAPPVTIPPTINWDNAVGNTAPGSTGATLHNGLLTITADRTVGDAMMLDTGRPSFFRTFNATMNIVSGPLLETSTANNLLFGSGGTLSVISNNVNGTHTTELTGKVTSMQLLTNPQLGGYDFVGNVSVTGGLLASGSRKFNSEALLFGMIFNVNRNAQNPNFDWTGKTKGNIGNLPAPPIPEPSTLALLSMGLGSLVTVTRRKLAKA
jgi:hypothetical protein